MFQNWVFIKIMWNQQKSDIRIMIYQTHFNVRLQNSFSILFIVFHLKTHKIDVK